MPGKHYFLTIALLGLLTGCQSVAKRQQAEAPPTPPVSSENKTARSEESTANSHLDPNEAAPVKEKAPVSQEQATVDDLQIRLIKNGQEVATKEPSKIKPNEQEAKEAHDKVMAAAAVTAEQTEGIANKHEEIVTARKAGAVAADKALGWLKNGNRRFTKGFFRADGASAKDRSRLIAGQKPHSTVFSCSDSRVPPEIVLDQKLGEIYTVRVSGRVLNANTISSIEYAVQYLGTNLVVLLGHENCNASEDSVRTSILEQSKILRDAVATGDVKVISARYDLKSGAIDWSK